MPACGWRVRSAARGDASRSQPRPLRADRAPRRAAAAAVAIEPRVRDGEVHDHFVQLTEGVIAARGRSATRAPPRGGRGRALDASRSPAAVITAASSSRCARPPRRRARRRGRVRRLGLAWPGHPERAAHRPRRAPRRCTSTRRAAPSQLGADRRYTGPGLPARHARPRRHPAGRLRAGAVAAVLARLRGRGSRPTATARVRRSATRSTVSARARGRAAAPAPVLRPDAGRAAARASCALTRAARRCCPSGATGTGRAATSTSTSATSRTTSTATARTASRSTRSSSTRRGRRSTTPGSSTRTSSPTRRGWSRACATTACAPSCGSRRG